MSKWLKITIALAFILSVMGIISWLTQDIKLYGYVYKKEVCKLIGRKIVPCWPESTCPVNLPCHAPYFDAGKACRSDEECIGGCNLAYPKAEEINYGEFYPKVIFINNVKCERREDNLSFTMYTCPNKLIGKCASFSFDEDNMLNLKNENSIIFSHPVYSF